VVQAHQFRRDQEPDEFEKRNPVTGGWKHGSTWKVDKTDEVAEDHDQPTPIRINNNARALAWIEKVYTAYPQTWQNNHVMPLGGSGDDQQFAMFELVPSMSQRGAVEIKWFQAYPLRQGVGTRAMQELQRLAQADGISLTLFPWDKGQVSQSKLMKFYKGTGFQPTVKGSKSLAWSPEPVAEDAIQEDAVMGKIEQSGKIVRILKKQHTVPFSDEKDWLLIDTDPARGNRGLGLKWIPAHTRFEWVRPYRDTAQEGYGDHPSQRVDPRTGKRYVPPPSPLKPSMAENFADGRGPGRPGDSQRHGIKARLAEGLEVDVPNEDWLQNKIDYAKSKGRDSFGVPYMGSTTASVRGTPPRVRVMRLASLPGMRNEQMNVRRDDLKWLMDYMERTGKLPPKRSDPNDEYLPFIMVAYNGEAWVNEGNHRIMAAYRLNWPDMPVEIRYFDGGERVASGPMAPGKIGLGPVKEEHVLENFADGRGPGRPGDSQRHGIPKGATMAELEKASHAKGRKGQLARWQLNMRRGKKK
jgi:hypothetical protein